MVAVLIASIPSRRRDTMSMACESVSRVRGGGTISGRAEEASEASNAPHRLQPCPRVNLTLRQHRCLRAEALDDAAHEGADAA